MKQNNSDGNSSGQDEKDHLGATKSEQYYAMMPIGIAITAPNLASARAQMTAVAKGLSVLPSIKVEHLRAVLYQDYTQVFPAVRVKEDESKEGDDE